MQGVRNPNRWNLMYHYLKQTGRGEYKIQKIDAFITELLDGNLVLHQLNLPDVRSAHF